MIRNNDGREEGTHERKKEKKNDKNKNSMNNDNLIIYLKMN